MSDADAPSGSDFKQASSNLNEGLKTCQAVISGYRALLVPKKNVTALADKQNPGSLEGQDELFRGD